MFSRILLITCLILATLATGCGQKGPLYLPEDAAEDPTTQKKS